MSSLFALSTNLVGIEALLESDNLDPAQLEELTLSLVETEEGFEEKVESYCGIIGELEALAEARHREAVRLATLTSETQNKAIRLRNALKDALLRTNRNKVQTTRYNVRVQKAGGKQPMLLHTDAVPGEWTVSEVVVRPDKTRIREALEAGEVLEFAELAERGTLLVIR